MSGQDLVTEEELAGVVDDYLAVRKPDVRIARLLAEVRRLRELPRGACPECRMLVSVEVPRSRPDEDIGLRDSVREVNNGRIVVRHGGVEYSVEGLITRR